MVILRTCTCTCVTLFVWIVKQFMLLLFRSRVLHVRREDVLQRMRTTSSWADDWWSGDHCLQVTLSFERKKTPSELLLLISKLSCCFLDEVIGRLYKQWSTQKMQVSHSKLNLTGASVCCDFNVVVLNADVILLLFLSLLLLLLFVNVVKQWHV